MLDMYADTDEMVTVDLPEQTGEVHIYNEYMDPEHAPQPGDECSHSGMHYGGRQSRHELEERDVYVPIRYASWGDYCGGTVERANHRWLVENYGAYLVQTGLSSHDGHGLLLKVGSRVPAELLNVIEGLEDYPLVDDEVLWEIEMDLERDDMECWLRDDLVREIEADQDWYDIEDYGITSEEVEKAYWDLRADDVIRWEAETATSGYVPSMEQAAADILQHILTKRALEIAGLTDGHPELF